MLFLSSVWTLCVVSVTTTALSIDYSAADLFPLDKRFEIQVNLAAMGMTVKSLNTPVHESLSRSSLYLGANIGSPTGSVKEATVDVKEFLRGAFWNDDPACQLFSDQRKNNFAQSSGALWTKAFTTGKYKSVSMTNIIARSHFGDLQFLHAMGSKANEPPTETRQKILQWAEGLYELASGRLKGSAVLQSTRGYSTYFNDKTSPKGSATISDLLTCQTKYAEANIRYRALGSLLHILQDSYAKGHTERRLLNPKDLKKGSKTEFVEGSYAELGPVRNFHCYQGQGKEHGQFDHWSPTFKNMDLAHPDSFNPLWGARMALDHGTTLVKLWHNGTSWESGTKAFFQGIFAIDSTATPSNNNV